MGFWHTGYAEFHEYTGLEGYAFTPSPVRYACEHCAEHFGELEALRHHRFERHPLRQPALFFRGRAVGTVPLHVLTALQPSEVLVEDATRCVVNGRSVRPARLGQLLAAMRRQFVDLELANGEVSARYSLDFRVVDDGHLAGVELAFLRMVRDRILTIDAVARFIQDCRGFPSAMPYCDGICHYLYGVMAKEQSPDSGLRHGQYVERFVRASDELAALERPLARTICALIAFHFNQFDKAAQLASGGALERAAQAFSALVNGMPWCFETAALLPPGNAVEHLLTDQDTLELLDDACNGLAELKTNADELSARLSRSPPGGYDRMKRAMLAAEALAARDDKPSHRAARALARQLAPQHDTSVWAAAMLDRLKTT